MEMMKRPAGRRGNFAPWIAFPLLTYLFSSSSAVNPDSVGYFSYLPSLVFDGDLRFLNQFGRLNMSIPLTITARGYVATHWPIGSAVLWSPFYFAARAFWFLSGQGPTDGCSEWFWRFVNLGTMVYAAAAVALSAGVLRKLGARGRMPISSVLFAAAGTPFIFYALLVPSTSHGPSIFINTLVVAATLATSKDGSRPRWFVLGILSGIAATVRAQNILFLLFPMAEWTTAGGREVLSKLSWPAAGGRNDLSKLLWLLAGAVAGFSPQGLTAWILNGSPLSQPSAFNVGWSHFALASLVFSPFHGLLFWTPIFLLGVAGLTLAVVGREQPGLPRWPAEALLAILVADLIVNACCLAWWEGHSFGLRQTTGVWIAVAAGIFYWRAFMRRHNKRWAVLGWGVPLMCALWTMGLLFHTLGDIPLDRYVSARELFEREGTLPSAAIHFLAKAGMGRRPSTGLWLILSAVACGFYWMLSRAWRRLAGGETRNLVLSCLVALALIDAVLLAADRRRNPVSPQAVPGTLSNRELELYFQRQAEEQRRTIP